MKIAIIGIGGVGGFIGGKLAATYTHEHEIIFVSRGDNAKTIRANGLKLHTHEGEMIARPALVTDQPADAGAMDLVVCCVKSYDLESSLKPLKNNVTASTAILPLLNGVDAAERIEKIFPQADVLDGCIYIVARLAEPGVVRVTGTSHLLHFGSDHGFPERLRFLEKLFRSAGIETHLSKNIQQTMWEKFLFISPLATLTSYLDLNLGDILSREENKKLLVDLLMELKAVTDAKGITLSENIIEKHLVKMASLPYETTSSMHSDFKKGGRTEVDSLTGYVIRAAQEYKIPVPLYEKMFTFLTGKK